MPIFLNKMKLLILTQAVDTEDPVLGFFVRWIEEFAKHVEHVEVICLRLGRSDLPKNVRVHSLGKEKGASRVKYVWNFYRYIWQLRHDYDAVFVHMNPEYMILGGLFWRMWDKHIVFWYNHPQDDLRLKMGALFAHTILHTSPYAATARFDNARRMPAGIDTKLFAPQLVPRAQYSLYIQGRVAPSKRIHILLEALRLLRDRNIPATVTIVGPEDIVYGQKLRRDFADLITLGAVSFLGPKRNEETPTLYASHYVAINLAAAGHYDKSVLEAMACETPVIVSSKAFAGLIPGEWIIPENDPKKLASTIETLFKLPDDSYRALGADLRRKVEERESLTSLGEKVAAVLAVRSHLRRLRAIVWRVLTIFTHIFPHTPRMTVLFYHSISDSSDFFAVPPDQFERQMQYVRKHFDVVPLARAFAHAAGERVKRDSIAITVDDGYRDFVTEALPVLKRHNIPSTVFIIGDIPIPGELGNDHSLLSKSDAQALADPLIEVGSHTQTHKKLTKISAEEALREMQESRIAIGNTFGVPVRYLSYPKGSYNKSVMRDAAIAGYAGAVTVVERGVKKGDSPYALPRIQIDSTTSFSRFRAKLTRAADWYYALWSLLAHRK